MVTVTWILVIVMCIAWEVMCRRSGGRWTSISTVWAVIWGRPMGRILLIGLWGFVGWHFFARYTLPT